MANILCTYSLTIRFFSLLKNWNKKNLIEVHACTNAFHSEHIQDYLIYPYFIARGTYKCNYFYFLLLIHSFLFPIPNYHCVNESHSLDIFRITSFTWISHDHFKSRFYLFLIVSFTKRSTIHNDWIAIFIISMGLFSFHSIFHHLFPL